VFFKLDQTGSHYLLTFRFGIWFRSRCKYCPNFHGWQLKEML